MNLFRALLILNLIFIFSSCGTVREAFTNQKKNSSDEFLVEKKSPLVMPPDFDELPVPKPKESVSEPEEKNLKKLIINNDDSSITDSKANKNNNFEETILEKIKNN